MSPFLAALQILSPVLTVAATDIAPPAVAIEAIAPDLDKSRGRHHGNSDGQKNTRAIPIVWRARPRIFDS
jgi:hypothetical protein